MLAWTTLQDLSKFVMSDWLSLSSGLGLGAVTSVTSQPFPAHTS